MLATGFASPAQNFLYERLTIEDFIQTNKISTYFFKIEEQHSTLFNPNDIIVIDKSLALELDQSALIIHQGEFKLIHYQNDRLVNLKNNEVISPPFELWGVVTYIIRSL